MFAVLQDLQVSLDRYIAGHGVPEWQRKDNQPTTVIENRMMPDEDFPSCHHDYEIMDKFNPIQ